MRNSCTNREQSYHRICPTVHQWILAGRGSMLLQLAPMPEDSVHPHTLLSEISRVGILVSQ